MKIRSGFVSNSSSSSFTCLITEKLHKDILVSLNKRKEDSAQETEWFKKFLDVYVDRVNKFGQTLVQFTQTTGNDAWPYPSEAFNNVFTKNEIAAMIDSGLDIDEVFYALTDFYKDEVRNFAKQHPDSVYINTADW